jgi:hypothetical protein
MAGETSIIHADSLISVTAFSSFGGGRSRSGDMEVERNPATMTCVPTTDGYSLIPDRVPSVYL